MDKQIVKFLAIRIISNLLIFGAIAVIVLTYGQWVWGNAVFAVTKARGVTWQMQEPNAKVEKSFLKALIDKTPLAIAPVNKEFSIIIPRIGLSVPVVKNVSVANKDEYLAALKNGVAHAVNTSMPGESGNSYYFSHSSLDFWELGPFATSFNLLNRLSPGDMIYVFYKDKKYVYKILQTEIVKGWDTTPYYREFIRPMLTLQTCDPPGTTINRLLVLAELVE